MERSKTDYTNFLKQQECFILGVYFNACFNRFLISYFLGKGESSHRFWTDHWLLYCRLLEVNSPYNIGVNLILSQIVLYHINLYLLQAFQSSKTTAGTRLELCLTTGKSVKSNWDKPGVKNCSENLFSSLTVIHNVC